MKSTLKHRVFAWVLTLAMVLTSVNLPQITVKVQAASGSTGHYEAITIASGSLNGNAILGASEQNNYSVMMDNNAKFYAKARKSEGGLPNDGKLTMNSGAPYYLAAGDNTATAYDGNDCIRLTNSSPSQKMNLETIGVYDKIYVLATAGGPGTGKYANFNVTLTYTDNTSNTTTYKLYDWYDLTNVSGVEKYYQVCRMESNGQYTGTTGTGGGPVLHSATINVNKQKLLKAITFTMTGKGEGNTVSSDMSDLYSCVFAVTGVTPDGVPGTPVASNATKEVGDASGAFTANWNAVNGATGYVLDVATNRNFTNMVSGYNNLSVGNTTSYKIKNGDIKSDITYYYRVRAVNNNGQSLSSNRIATDLPEWVKAAVREGDQSSISYNAESNTVTFNKDITLKSTMMLPTNDATIFELQGHTVTAPEGQSAVSAGNGKNVELSISSEGGQGVIKTTGTDSSGNGISAIDFSDASGNNAVKVEQTTITGSDGTSNDSGSGGNGGAGINANTNVTVEINNNAKIQGGNGGSTESGCGGTGGSGVMGGNVTISTNGSVTGGNGGDAITGTGGTGGTAVSGKNITNSGTVIGGNGGDATTGVAGNGGIAAKSSSNTVKNSGSVTGGNGGDGSTGGTGGSAGVTSGTSGTQGQNGYSHTHVWSYASGSSADTMKATCTQSENQERCAYPNGVEITINARTIAYTGMPYNTDGTDIICDKSKLSVIGAATTLTYYKKAQTRSADTLGEKLKEAPTDVGDYVVVCTLSNKQDDSTTDQQTVNIQTEFSITKATPKVSVKATEDLTYNGDMQNLVISSTNDGTVYYRIGEDGAWSTEIPTAIEAETSPYTVYYYVKGDSNHTDIGSETEPAGSVNAVIAKAAFSAEDIQAEPVIVTYDKQEHTIQKIRLSGEAADATVTYAKDRNDTFTGEMPTYTEAGEHTVYYKVSKKNYADSVLSTTLTINPKKVDAIWGDRTLTYNGQKQAPTATAADIFDGDTCNLTVEGAQKDVNKAGETYTAYVAGSDNPNYEVTGETAFMITPKEIGLGWSDTEFTYNGNAQAPTAIVSGVEEGDE